MAEHRVYLSATDNDNVHDRGMSHGRRVNDYVLRPVEASVANKIRRPRCTHCDKPEVGGCHRGVDRRATIITL